MGLVQVALMTICPWCAKHGAPSLVSPGGASLPRHVLRVHSLPIPDQSMALGKGLLVGAA